MQTTQHSSTCQVHAHPALHYSLVMQVRRQARDAGCQYVTREQRRRAQPSSTGPFGGDAA
jgi:hypothetical protein